MKLKSSLILLVGSMVSISACTNNSSSVSNVPQDSSNQVNISSVRADHVVQIKLKNPAKDLISLSTKNFDLFGYKVKQKTVNARISTDEQNKLTSLGFKFNDTLEQNVAGSSGLLPGYLSYAQMKSKLDMLVAQNPAIAAVTNIGSTWEKTQGKSPNNIIWSINISSKKTADKKPGSLFIGGMHARELAPPEIMVKLAETLITQYGKDPAITQLVDTRDINIIPMVNVDGRIQVEKGNAWQRKNTHGQGVDLNRNFDSHWNYDGLNVPADWHDGDSNQSGETYSGTAPASEPEVKAIQDFYATKPNLNLVLDMHSYGEMFFWPVGYSNDAIPEAAMFKNIYNNSFKNINYQGGTSMSLLYPTTATTDDYAYVKHHIMGLGMEVGQSFRPNYSEVETMWNQLKPNLLYLIKVSNTPVAAR